MWACTFTYTFCVQFFRKRSLFVCVHLYWSINTNKNISYNYWIYFVIWWCNNLLNIYISFDGAHVVVVVFSNKSCNDSKCCYFECYDLLSWTKRVFYIADYMGKLATFERKQG